MPIIRNPFSRRAPGDSVTDENGRPVSSPRLESAGKSARPHPGPLDLGAAATQQPAEYKLSEINDSGVFLPPSPTTEKPKFWSSRSQSSTTSSSQRSVFTDSDNPFTIGRESFDSYRRSFDISARSPVLAADASARHSLDTRRLRMPLPALRDGHVNPPESQPEERFEDIGLNDELEAARPKRTGIFSRFTSSTHDPYAVAAPAAADGSRPSSSHFGTQFFGRKRASGTHGAELGSVGQGQATDKTDKADRPDKIQEAKEE